MNGTIRPLLVAGMVAAPAMAWADWPTRPITMVVPYAAGGLTDVSSRLIGERLSQELGQPIVVENRAGAGSTVASNWVRAQPADGYTIYAAPVSLVLNHLIQDEVEYSLEDFDIISGWIDSPFILHVNPAMGVTDLDGLLAEIRANPDTFSIGTSGIGAINHLAAEAWIDIADIDIEMVHYSGGAPARQDLLGNNIQMMFAAAIEVLPLLEAGSTVGVGVTTRERLEQAPDIPTVEEAMGLDNFEAVFWMALLLPAGADAEVIDTLSAAMTAVGQDEDLRAELAANAVVLNIAPADEVAARFDAAVDVFGPLLERVAGQ